jgi:guanylate kinase
LSRKASLIVVSGPSGAGKSTVLARVLAEMDRLRFSVSHTTRGPRPGEQDGVQYFFVAEERFRELRQQGAFLEWATVHGQLYGTSLGEYERAVRDGVDLLLDLDVQGAAQVRLKFPDAVSVFILPPSRQALEQRMRNRGQDSEEVIAQRLAAAREEMSHYGEFDFVIVNEHFDTAVDEMCAIFVASRVRKDQQVARHARLITALLADDPG